ncbi:MAG: type IV secretory system conjugative DNA transfer family protein [Alphaproteobacteria bacterium]|nr:type IV secretory system conjugative DNA transfer family protein [Alphaproteobacteria bacterium]
MSAPPSSHTSQTSRPQGLGERLISAALLVAGSIAVLHFFGPIKTGIELHLIPTLALIGVIAGGTTLGAELFRVLADFFGDKKARTPAGIKGAADWGTLKSVACDLCKGWGPYWGAIKGEAIFAEFASNALTLGPAGTGKGVGVIIPTILSIFGSKFVVDFKGELACMLARVLRERGEIVRILNIGEMWTDILGASDCYNPLNLIADNFWRPGGLQDVSGDTNDMSLQLYPEPSGGGGGDDNKYFRDGSRKLIAFVIIIAVLIHGAKATLGHVQTMLEDREFLLQNALWVAGRLPQGDGSKAAMPIERSPWAPTQSDEDLKNFMTYIKGVASSTAALLQSDDSRTLDSFLTGAQQALARFDLTTRAHKYLSKSTFRFADLKTGKPTTVFLVADASRIESQKDALGLVQWCMAQELKRAEDKHRSVNVIADECTNFKLTGLGSLLTWGRAYGIRLHLIIQSLSAFRQTYGEETLNTLLSETEIKQVLPGQREPQTLKLVEEMLGARAVIAESDTRNADKEFFGMKGGSLSEDARPLMTADEIRRTDKAILFIRGNRPLLVDTPPVAAIHPFRDQIDINPFHGKPYRLPIRLRIR